MSRAYLLPLLLLTGCQFLYPPLADERVPLADMDEPLELFEEPDDELARRALAKGAFTGIYVGEAADSLEELTEEGPGVAVTRVVENSPGERAGLEQGDVILDVRVNDDSTTVPIGWPSQWREVELAATPGDILRITYERAAVDRGAALTPVPRPRHPDRVTTERFREEEKVGVVIRTATEVEARAAELPPGGGAVVVGMSRRSPWRNAGLRFNDLITNVDGETVAHPQAVIAAIARTEPGTLLSLTLVRDGQTVPVNAPVSEREPEVTGFSIPLIFSHANDRGSSDTSVLFGLLGYKTTAVAWEIRLLWFIRLTGGEAERLETVEGPDQ